MRSTHVRNWVRYALPIVMIGAFAVACGDDDEGTGVTIADLVGTWTANSFVLSNNPLLPQDPVDLVLVGATVSMNIAADGSFTFSAINLPLGLDDVILTGDIEITGDGTATVTTDDDPDDPAPATFNLDGDSLTLSIPDADLIDFNDDGTIEDAEQVDLTATMTRIS
jgi:hypothetical protein